MLRAAISAGMTKINVSTRLDIGFTARVRQILGDSPAPPDPRQCVGPGMKDVGAEAEGLLRR